MAEKKGGCVSPAPGPIVDPVEPTGSDDVQESMEVVTMQARVGTEAPDFEANAFVAGKGFQPVKLSDYKGKWIVLCFYPGDFTFV